MAEPESETERRQREADPFVAGLTEHALETADTERLADLIEGFLTSNDRQLRDAFIMGLVRAQGGLTGERYTEALQKIHEQLGDPPTGGP